MYCNDCAKLLNEVNETSFALDDAVLYLDIHHHDKEALAYYQDMKRKYEIAVKAYENACGPLTDDSVEPGPHFSWMNGPWPWETGGND